MARVFIPAPLRDLTGGRQVVEAEGKNLREVIAALEACYPGMRDRLCRDGGPSPGLSFAVDGAVTSLGLLQPVDPDSEVHFLPAIGGG